MHLCSYRKVCRLLVACVDLKPQLLLLQVMPRVAFFVKFSKKLGGGAISKEDDGGGGV